MPENWYEIGDGWTPEIKTRCARRCGWERACYELGGQGLIGGEVELITPCSICKENPDD